LLYTFYTGRVSNPDTAVDPPHRVFTWSDARRFVGTEVDTSQITIHVPPEHIHVEPTTDSICPHDAKGRWLNDVWVPFGCRLPLLDRDQVGRCLRGRRIAWVGDSVNANMNRLFAHFINLPDRDNTMLFMVGDLQDHILHPGEDNIISHWLEVKGLWRWRNWTVDDFREMFRMDDADPMDVFVLNVGMHDAGWQTIPMYRRTLRHALSLLQATMRGPVVLLNSGAPHMDLPGYPGFHSRERVIRFNKETASVAAEFGFPVVDMFALTDAVPHHHRDSIHPKDLVLTVAMNQVAHLVCDCRVPEDCKFRTYDEQSS